MKTKILSFVILWLLLMQAVNFSQFPSESDIIKLKAYLDRDRVYPGSEFKVAFVLDIKKPWHINSNKPNDEYLIPTKIKLLSKDFELKGEYYPLAKEYEFPFSSKPVSVFDGIVKFGTLVYAKPNLKPDFYEIFFEIDYQACDNKSCMPPNSIKSKIVVEITSLDKESNPINQEIFADIDIKSSFDVAQQSDISEAFASGGLLLSLVLAFLGGLALNLTPCVYPLIPITIGYFGGQSQGDTRKLALMGGVYVLGMAVTYSIIGVITALSGAMFGALLQNPIALLFIAAVLIGLSLSFFDVYEFRLPDSIVQKAGAAKAGLVGALFMGLTMGIVAAPCIGPFVIGLLTFVAAKQDVLLGFLLFFSLALGLGLPYFLLAIFSGKIKSLPKSGEWMDGVKRIFGVIMIIMAFYFLIPLFPKNIEDYILPLVIIIGFSYLLFDQKGSSIKLFRNIKYALSTIAILLSLFILFKPERETIEWIKYDNKDFEKHLNLGKPIILDFYADWCLPCKELDKITFSDPEVVKESKRFVSYKIDLTIHNSQETKELREKFGIVGVPTVILFDSKGKEAARINQFVSPEEMLKKMQIIE